MGEYTKGSGLFFVGISIVITVGFGGVEKQGVARFEFFGAIANDDADASICADDDFFAYVIACAAFITNSDAHTGDGCMGQVVCENANLHTGFLGVELKVGFAKDAIRGVWVSANTHDVVGCNVEGIAQFEKGVEVGSANTFDQTSDRVFVQVCPFGQFFYGIAQFVS